MLPTVTSRATILVVMNLKQLYDAVDSHHLWAFSAAHVVARTLFFYVSNLLIQAASLIL